MTIEDDMTFLGQVPLLRRLGAGALRILAIGAERYSVEAGQVLFAAGDAADCAYIIQQGSFGLNTGRTGDGEVIAEPGALLGELALLTESVRPGTATAREDSTVVRISRAVFLKMLDSNPDAAQRLRELVASHTDQWVRELDNARAALARGTGPQ